MKRKMMSLLCLGVLILGGCAQTSSGQDATQEYLELDLGGQSEPMAETSVVLDQPIETEMEPVSEISVGVGQSLEQEEELNHTDHAETKDSSIPETAPQAESTVTTENDSCYLAATDIPHAEVENYAVQIKKQFLEHDWSAIVSEIAYPITVADVTYNNSAEFLEASNGFDGNLEDAFFVALEGEDCSEMFCNWQGIMLGENGQVWISEIMDAELNSQGLKISAINGMLK